jgi:hypothetical protein
MPIRQEVLKFISACELIHELLAGGGILTGDERSLVETEANDLLAAIGHGGPGGHLRSI